MSIERKTFALEKADLTDAGEFSGYANVSGVVDGGGDRVMPGAFAKAVPDFLKEGFISWSHDWGTPVAMPVEAKEDDHGLLIRAKFHSTSTAQDARTITAERLTAGLTMGLSIGYGVEAESRGKDGARQLDIIYPLFETGLVMVPMNALSTVTAVKGTADPAGSLSDSIARIADDLPAIVKRLRGMADQRTKEGRVLSASNRQLVRELLDALGAASGSLSELLDATDPEKSARRVLTLLEEARFLGVPV